MTLTFMCLFYAPFLFYTLGDSVGAAKAAWVIVVLAVLPLLMRVGAARSAHTERSPTLQTSRDIQSVEMRGQSSEVGRSASVVEAGKIDGATGIVSALHAHFPS
jgi:K+-transporting ATPase A subunit